MGGQGAVAERELRRFSNALSHVPKIETWATGEDRLMETKGESGAPGMTRLGHYLRGLDPKSLLYSVSEANVEF